MSVLAIIQARMTSSRLPGKVLLPIMGRPVLSYQVERVRRAARVGRIVIATTTNASDDPIVSFAETAGVAVHRGAEADVLSRVAGAARALGAGAQAVMRLTADCPLLDPAVIDAVADRRTAADGPFDYATNALPRTWPIGLDVEVMTAAALAIADREAVDAYDREHVTPFLYGHPERFRLAHLPCQEPLSQHRWTLDEPADFELIRAILEALYPNRPGFGYRDVIALIERRPELGRLNAGVAQKARRYEEIAVKAMAAAGGA